MRPAPLKLWTALLTVYLVWGSTYLAIKISVRTLPPLLSAGARFLAAGILLAAIVDLSGRSLRVSRRQLLSSAAAGTMLLTLGVGVVTLSETRIDSSIAAMIAGSVPLQVVALRLLARERVAVATRLAAAAGLGGLALIVVPGGASGGSSAIGLALMLGASMSWSTGSFVSRRLDLPPDPFVATAYEMLAGGGALVALALAVGEGVRGVDASTASVAAWAYLVLAGSLVGFTAYAWLLRNAPISQVVTHQYANPIVALALGTLLLGERLAAVALAGAAVVLVAVFVTVRREARPPQGREVARGDAERAEAAEQAA
ncbi:MAG TPA: EamA family transporter [Gaiellaceae bacterium]|nr:EamA family transporter [Gaiellaceae bacterium]